MKKYIIIAGVNGCGKTTLFQTMDSLADMPRINVDEIVRETGDWRNKRDVERRYITSFDNLKLVTPLCDKVELFDNTNAFIRVGIFENMLWKTIYAPIPEWAKPLLVSA